MTMANFIPVMTIFATFIVIANVPNSYASECTLSNIEILSKFIDERINATVSTMVAEFTATLEESIAASVNATLNALNATVDEKIATIGTTVGAHDVSIFKLLSQSGRCVNYALISLKAYTFSFQHCSLKYIKKPKKEAKFIITYIIITCYIYYNSCTILPFKHAVMKMVYINVNKIPRVRVRSIDTSTQLVGDTFSLLTISNTSVEYTSVDNILAYRPNYSSNSGGNTAIAFVNMEAIFPCYKQNQIGPVCQLFTYENDSFQFGKAFIQSSDIGNHVFNNQNITTFGFGVSGCSTFDEACVSNFEAVLVCLLPPALNQCGISEN
jgi:hypothetical protein